MHQKFPISVDSKNFQKLIALLIFTDKKINSQAYRLENTEFSWIPFTGSNKFKQKIAGIVESLLQEVGADQYTIIRSETYSEYTINILQTDKKSFAMVTTDTDNNNSLIIKMCMRYRDEHVDAEFLIDVINQELENLNKINRNKQELKELQSIMLNNVEKVIENQETLEDLLIRTQNLEMSAQQFKSKSRNLNRWCCYIM